MEPAPTRAGIAAVGFYIPRQVITAEEYRKAVGDFAAPGILEKAVPAFDEDAVTMAVEAADRALAGTAEPVKRLVYLSSASGGAPTVAQALGIDAATAEEASSPVRAVTAAFEHAQAGRATLLVASDAPRAKPKELGEHALGAAAVAFLVAPGGLVVRADGPAYAVELERNPRERIGDAGIAMPFLQFLEVLRTAKAGTRLAMEGLAFEVTGTPRGDPDLWVGLESRTPVTHEQYVAMRHHEPPAGTEYSQGAYVSMPAYLGEAKARYRLVGERCAKCGRVHFPPRESCVACGAVEWVDVALDRTGSVYAFTIIGKGAAPSEFLEQQNAVGAYGVAVVELEDGPRVSAMLTDVEPKDVRIGMPVRMVFRRLYTQEGVSRYGFKFAPQS